MERQLTDLVAKLKTAHGAKLISVVLYGSAATTEKDQFSDYNVLSVLSEVTPTELGEAEPVFHWWREMRNPAPLLLSELEVRTSTDCFPIEFTDIKARHQILHGTDVVAGVEIDYAFYRAQVEHELRAKLLRLRQKAGGVLSDKDLLLRLMADSVSTFCVLFRHALLLDGQPAVWERKEVVNAAAQHFGIDPKPLHLLLGVRDGTIKAKDTTPLNLLEEYLKQVRVVVDRVDEMKR